MERENRLGRFVERKRLNFVARSVATMSLAAGGIVAVEKTGVFDPLASSVDSANHLVLKTPHKAYEQLIEMLPGAENAEAQTWKQQPGSIGARARLHANELWRQPGWRQAGDDLFSSRGG